MLPAWRHNNISSLVPPKTHSKQDIQTDLRTMQPQHRLHLLPYLLMLPAWRQNNISSLVPPNTHSKQDTQTDLRAMQLQHCLRLAPYCQRSPAWRPAGRGQVLWRTCNWVAVIACLTTRFYSIAFAGTLCYRGEGHKKGRRLARRWMYHYSLSAAVAPFTQDSSLAKAKTGIALAGGCVPGTV